MQVGGWGETLTRLTYLAHRHLGLSRWEVALMPPGVLLDLVECHHQYENPSRVPVAATIDEVIPAGL